MHPCRRQQSTGEGGSDRVWPPRCCCRVCRPVASPVSCLSLPTDLQVSHLNGDGHLDHPKVRGNLTFERCHIVRMLALSQCVYLILEAGASSPWCVAMSSATAGSMAFISILAGHTCYGTSDVTLKYIARKIHFDI